MLDVVIPHLNSKYLDNCLRSLKDKTPSGILSSITLVDQSTSPQSRVGQVDNHLLTRQVGFARAANMGISLGHAPYVMVLNDDCQFLDDRWWWGILKTFNTHENLLCVNPSSPHNPGTSSEYRAPQQITAQVYSSLLNGKLLDGICMWAPVFRRETLNSVPGCSPGLWFDELFWPGGGEDYDLNRRAYLSGLRCVGTEWSWVWHWWHSTELGGKKEAKNDGGTFNNKWKNDTQVPDLFGKEGNSFIPQNRNLSGMKND